MAENVQETRPPEPPPRAPEAPRPTEESNRAESKEQERPSDTQESAHQEARNAAQSEHAAAVNGNQDDNRDSLRPTPEFQAKLDEHTVKRASSSEPDGLQPTPEFQARLDEHTANKSERGGPEGGSAEDNSPRPADTDPGATGHRHDPPQLASAEDAARPVGEQSAAHDATRQASAAELAKAQATEPESAGPLTGPRETAQYATPEALAEGTPPGPSGPSGPPGISDGDRRTYDAQHLDPASDLRRPSDTRAAENENRQPLEDSDTQRAASSALAGAPQDQPSANGADQLDEVGQRLEELRDEGHGPQRHHDPTDEQLQKRLGDPVIDAQTGRPELKPNGHVKALDQKDPMTGTTVDGVTGNAHQCGDFATRIDSADDYVTADRYMRQRSDDSGLLVVKAPISEVLGPDAHERMTGFYHDPAAPGEQRRVNFEGGNIVAVYRPDADGNKKLYTMYPDPVPFNPS